jgi:hypothetical protein
VLHVFLLRADFITNDLTTLSGFALIPPLLESINMNWVGRFDFFFDSGGPVCAGISLRASIVCPEHCASLVLANTQFERQTMYLSGRNDINAHLCFVRLFGKCAYGSPWWDRGMFFSPRRNDASASR